MRPFESTPNGWNLTVNLKHQTTPIARVAGSPGHHDDGTTLSTDGESRTHDGNWTTEDTSFWVAGRRLNERSLEPLTETDGDETMMNHLGDDDAGETSAFKSKIQPMKPSDLWIAAHEA